MIKTGKPTLTFLTALLCMSLFSCGEEKEQAEIIRPVRHKQVFLMEADKSRTFSGISESGSEAQLSFRVSGIIRKIDGVVGQKVKKGRIIASIDPADAILAYDKAVSAEKNAKVQMETAKSNLERIKGLYEKNNISLNEYEAAKNKYAAARSDHSSGRKNSALKKRELGYYKLYSPMDGIVVSKDVNENENVTAGQAVVKINSEGDIRVMVGIPEKYISLINEKMAVKVTFSSLPGQAFEGGVTEISYSVSSSSTYPVKIELNETSPKIRPGMPASITFDLAENTEESALYVPANTVGEDSEGNFVFTVTPTEDGYGIVHKKKVQVGKLTNNGFPLYSGIRDGDYVITSGIGKMSEGKKVKFIK